MESLVKIVDTGVDTLVMNIYPTESAGVVIKRRVASDLQQELTFLKERAQVQEEDIVSRFVFDGGNLFMRTKGSERFNWIGLNSRYMLKMFGKLLNAAGLPHMHFHDLHRNVVTLLINTGVDPRSIFDAARNCREAG